MRLTGKHSRVGGRTDLMIWETWTSRWQAALEACARQGGDSRQLKLQGPASEAEVAAVERELGTRLPDSFRGVLTGFARGVEFKWFRAEDSESFPAPFREIFSGECTWDLDLLKYLEEGRRHWVDTVFPDPENEYDRVWHQKLAFMEVGNGDLLALDLAQAGAPVVYLSHDDGEGHGYLLGHDFADFMDRWTLLGCPGAEDWQILPFLSGPTSYLDASGERATQWRLLFGMFG